MESKIFGTCADSDVQRVLLDTPQVQWAVDNLATVNHGLRIGPSNIHGAGNGLFATATFLEGSVVTAFQGQLCTENDIVRRYGPHQSHEGGSRFHPALQRVFDLRPMFDHLSGSDERRPSSPSSYEPFPFPRTAFIQPTRVPYCYNDRANPQFAFIDGNFVNEQDYNAGAYIPQSPSCSRLSDWGGGAWINDAMGLERSSEPPNDHNNAYWQVAQDMDGHVYILVVADCDIKTGDEIFAPYGPAFVRTHWHVDDDESDIDIQKSDDESDYGEDTTTQTTVDEDTMMSEK